MKGVYENLQQIHVLKIKNKTRALLLSNVTQKVLASKIRNKRSNS